MSTDEKYLSGQVVLVGYGQIGQGVAATLTDKGIPFVVAEQNRETVERLRRRGFAAVCGNAAEPAVLIQAHIARAGLLLITTPHPFEARQMIETAKTLNPSVEIVVRTDNRDEAVLLAKEGIEKVLYSEDELAKSMSAHILKRFGKSEKAH